MSEQRASDLLEVRLRSRWIRGVQRPMDRRFQRRQIHRQRVPYGFGIDAIILVTEPVANSTNIAHGKPGQSASACSPRRTAASLMTCSLRSTAAIVFAYVTLTPREG